MISLLSYTLNPRPLLMDRKVCSQCCSVYKTRPGHTILRLNDGEILGTHAYSFRLSIYSRTASKAWQLRLSLRAAVSCMISLYFTSPHHAEPVSGAEWVLTRHTSRSIKGAYSHASFRAVPHSRATTYIPQMPPLTWAESPFFSNSWSGTRSCAQHARMP